MATIEPYALASGAKRYRVRYRTPENNSTDKSGFTTKRDAQAFAATVEVSKLRGEYVAPAAGRVTVGHLVRQWRAGRSDLRPSTAERYDGIIRTHIAPQWDGVPLATVRHSDVQRWTTELAASGMAAASVRKVYRVLSLALDLAVADRMIAVSPATGVKIARPSITPRRYLGHEQVAKLASATEGRAGVVLVLAYCGLRWGELAALKVRNVDLMRRRITVEESVPRSAVGWCGATPRHISGGSSRFRGLSPTS